MVLVNNCGHKEMAKIESSINSHRPTLSWQEILKINHFIFCLTNHGRNLSSLLVDDLLDEWVFVHHHAKNSYYFICDVVSGLCCFLLFSRFSIFYLPCVFWSYFFILDRNNNFTVISFSNVSYNYFTYFVPVFKYCYSDSRNLWTLMRAGGLAP